MLTICLTLSLFILFYILFGGKVPAINSIKDFVTKFAIPAASAILVFLVTSHIFQTRLAGTAWGFLGWFLPVWIMSTIHSKRQTKLREIAKSFINSMGGLYSAGQTTAQAVATCAIRLPEPFQSELQKILGQYKLRPGASFPKMFRAMGERLQLTELNGLAAIIAAAETAGGQASAARGLKRLARALRLRDKIEGERMKQMFETVMTAYIIIAILTALLFGWGLFGLAIFDSIVGKLILSFCSAAIVGMVFFVTKLSSRSDF